METFKEICFTCNDKTANIETYIKGLKSIAERKFMASGGIQLLSNFNGVSLG
jgi:hypothetical protein